MASHRQLPGVKLDQHPLKQPPWLLQKVRVSATVFLPLQQGCLKTRCCLLGEVGPSHIAVASQSKAAAAGELLGIPGVAHGAHGDVEDFLAQSRAGHARPAPHDFAEFERIYQGAQPGRSMGDIGPAGPMASLPGLTPSLHVSPSCSFTTLSVRPA